MPPSEPATETAVQLSDRITSTARAELLADQGGPSDLEEGAPAQRLPRELCSGVSSAA